MFNRQEYLLTPPWQFGERWVVRSRDQSRIIGSGNTLDEACRAAASAGESSVWCIRVPKPGNPWSRRGFRTVAVFVARIPAGCPSNVLERFAENG
jgi:hypothetical protein